jgi:hypothetical protein
LPLDSLAGDSVPKKANPSIKQGSIADDASPFSLISKVRQHQLREQYEGARRSTAAARSRRKVLEAVLSNAGFDLASIEGQHQREWELILRQASSQQKTAVSILKQQRARQRQALRTIVENRERFEYKKGNPHTSICMWKATGAPNVLVNAQTFSDGVAGLTRQPETTVRTGDNTIRFTAEARGRLPHDFKFSPVASVDFVTEHFFESTAPHDGTLSVTGTFAPLGTIFLGAPGDCVINSSAGADIRLYMRIIINPRSGLGFELPFGDTITIASENLISTCDGVSRLMVIGGTHAVAHQLSRENAVEVAAGDVVQVIAGYDTNIAAGIRGIASLDFFTAPRGFNVPMVLLRIDK